MLAFANSQGLTASQSRQNKVSPIKPDGRDQQRLGGGQESDLPVQLSAVPVNGQVEIAQETPLKPELVSPCELATAWGRGAVM